MSAIATAEFVNAIKNKASEVESRLVERARAAHSNDADKQKAEDLLKSLVEKLAKNMSGR